MTKYKECPYCAEQILAAAVKCKHCMSMLDHAFSESEALKEANIPPVSEKQPVPETAGSAEDGPYPANGPPPSPGVSSKQSVPDASPPPPPPAGSTPPPPPEVSPPPPPPTGSAPPPPPESADLSPATNLVSPPPAPPVAAPVPPPPSPEVLPPPPEAASSAGASPPLPPTTQSTQPPLVEPGAGSSGNLFRALGSLFGEGAFSAPRLAPVNINISLVVIVAAALLGPLFSLLAVLLEASSVSGIFGRLFVNIFVAAGLSNLLSLAALFVLLNAWFVIRKEKIAVNAHLSLVALVSVILFAAGLLTLIIRIVPWITIGYVLLAMVVFRYSEETFRRKTILDALAVLTAWLILDMLVINRLIGLIF